MKTIISEVRSAGIIAVTILLCLLGFMPSARALDNGIDPFNLGKGDWIYFMSAATNKLGGNVPSVTSIASLMAYEKSKGMNYVIVKAGDGIAEFPAGNPQFTTSLVNAAHAAGLKIFAYNRSWGTNVQGEINMAINMINRGADGFVIDAEAEWESQNLSNNKSRAIQLCQGIKNAFPNKFLAHSPFMYISLHSTFPYVEFGLYCDAVMPQAYFTSFGISPTTCVSDMNDEWNSWQNSLTGNNVNAIKPIAPVCQAWNVSSSETTTGAEITSFFNALKNSANPASIGGYQGINFWRADLHTTDMWNAIGSNTIGGTTPPVISSVAATSISDTSATITWHTDIGSDSVVNYGLTTSYGSTVSSATIVVNHSITLTGLSPSTTYHYRVRSKGTSTTQTTSGDFTFTTNPSGTVSDIIIDNPAATVVGSWTTTSLAADRFGSDYRYKGQGTGSSYLQFTPTIPTAGSYDVYEWHSAGANRTVGAPIVVNFNGGSQTISMNQQVAGGQWNFVGTFTFAAGTSGNVRITDDIPDAGQVVIADAIKFVFASAPPTPSAPSNLAATAAGSSQINLTWTDNSSIENNFEVLRSTVSGGPYTVVATRPANTTSYSNTGLSPSTTYYYRVRATNAGGASPNSNQASATTSSSSVADIVMDNGAATVSGTWSTGTSSVDRFGSDYRFKLGGSGSAFLRYRPTIVTAGQYEVFEWHPQGGNRTVAAPHIIAHSNGTTTVNVNQQVNGGQWNSLGVFRFSTGTTGNLRITDGFPDSAQVAMADAIKFVYVGP